MQILYAIQGTGNGHLSRAQDIIPILKKYAKVDLLVSGCQADLSLPYTIKYQLKGMSFIFGKTGGVNLLETYREMDSKKFWTEVKTLPILEYDLVINDFEPISAWAAKLSHTPCIGLSHQSAVLAAESPKPKKKDWKGTQILKHYAPTDKSYGFHFERYNDNILTPVIRTIIRDQDVTNLGHYTVYLPSYGDQKLIDKLSNFPNTKWQIFSKHTTTNYKHENIQIRKIDNESFVKSMASSQGVLCGAGFETPAEALFLGKKLMVIPMKNQYEQHCNAAALKKLGVPVLKNLKPKRFKKIEEWISNDTIVPVNYPNLTEHLINKIFSEHLQDIPFDIEEKKLAI